MIHRVSDRLASRLPFFYGYLMIPVAMFLQIATSPGQTFAVSAFTPSLRESLALSDSRLSLAYMLGTLFAAVPLSLVGPLSDRYGLKGITLLALVALSGTCYLASKVNGFLTLLTVFFLLRFLGQGSLSLLSGNSIAMWFRSRMGRVSALMSVGTAIAFAWIPGWISDSIAAVGWRATYQAMAVLVALVMLPLIVLLFRNRPEDVGQQVDGAAADESACRERASNSNEEVGGAPDPMVSLTLSEAIRGRAFYILAATNAMWALAGTGIVFYLFTLCADRGFDRSVPADLFKTFGLSMLAMQLIGGVLADFLPLNRLLCLGMVVLSAGLGLACVAETVVAMHGFAALFGGGQGLILAVGAVIWVRYYGRANLGSVRGTVWCLTVAGSGCGPLVMGVTRDIWGGFEPAVFAFFMVMCGLALAAWWATPPVKNHRTRVPPVVNHDSS